MLTIAVIVLVFAVRAVLKSSIKEENVQSVFAKILLNHVQMISITASFDMDWPESVKYIFAFAAPVKDLTDAIVQFDCFMDLRNPLLVDPYEFFADPKDLRVVYQKMLLYAAMPILIATVVYIVWAVIGRFMKWHTSDGGRTE